jgi:hypothetical protein
MLGVMVNRREFDEEPAVDTKTADVRGVWRRDAGTIALSWALLT